MNNCNRLQCLPSGFSRSFSPISHPVPPSHTTHRAIYIGVGGGEGVFSLSLSLSLSLPPFNFIAVACPPPTPRHWSLPIGCDNLVPPTETNKRKEQEEEQEGCGGGGVVTNRIGSECLVSWLFIGPASNCPLNRFFSQFSISSFKLVMIWLRIGFGLVLNWMGIALEAVYFLSISIFLSVLVV